MSKSCQSRLSILPNKKKTVKSLLKTCKLLPKWRNFAKCGHTAWQIRKCAPARTCARCTRCRAHSAWSWSPFVEECEDRQRGRLSNSFRCCHARRESNEAVVYHTLQLTTVTDVVLCLRLLLLPMSGPKFLLLLQHLFDIYI